MNLKLAQIFALALIIFSFLPICSAASGDLADFAYGLPADIVVQKDSFNASPARVAVHISINNPTGNDWIVYLLSNQNGTWKNERLVGVAQKNSRQNFDIDFEATYTGKKTAITQYALVATGNAVPLGKYFNIEEDWSGYEINENQKIFRSAEVMVPVFGGFIIIMLLIITNWAYKNKSPEEFKREYTLRSFFLPVFKNRPWTEIAADVLINPVFWALELAFLFVMAFAIWENMSHADGSDTVITLSFFGALIMPIAYFALLWIYNELVEKMPLRFLAGAFIWGISAAVISLVLNSAQAKFLLGPLGLDNTGMVLFTTALIAPFIEEVAKGFGLVVLWGHHEFSDALHGLHLGIAVGLGFSFVENWFYFASKTDPLQMGLAAWASLVIYRSFFNSIAHACFSASMGAALGWAKGQGWGKLAMISIIPGIIMATVLHSIFNITAIMDGFEALSANYLVYKYNPAMIVTLLALVSIMLVSATAERRNERMKRENKYRGR